MPTRRTILTELFCRRRWEKEKPFWFTDEWKSRIPKEIYEEEGVQGGRSRSSLSGYSFLEGSAELDAESKLRHAVRDVVPWSLDATALAEWLETNWVRQEHDESEEGWFDQQQGRRDHRCSGHKACPRCH